MFIGPPPPPKILGPPLNLAPPKLNFLLRSPLKLGGGAAPMKGWPWIEHDLCQLKHEGKITDSHVNNFKEEAKKIVSTLSNHILSKSPLTSYFACAAHCLNPINQAEIPDTCEKRFHNLQKLIDGKLIIWLFADEAKRVPRRCQWCCRWK